MSLSDLHSLKNRIIRLLQDKDEHKNLLPCGEAVVYLFQQLLEQPLCSQHSQQQLDALVDLANEKLLLFPYKDVPLCWRCLLMDATLVKSAGLLDSLENENELGRKRDIGKLLIKLLDTALIVSGSPGNNRRRLSLDFLTGLQEWLRPSPPENEQRQSDNCSTRRRLLTLNTASRLPVIRHPITILREPPDFLRFETHINETPLPLHFQCGLMAHWPACSTRPWTDIDYILRKTGDRIVPIEIGSKYTDSSWQQKMMRMEDFINDYILPTVNADDKNSINDVNTDQINVTQKPPAYLAQHNLFYHIPSLEDDIAIPDYCYAEAQVNESYSHAPPDIIKHTWFGPQGTVSPLHQDPYHNILAQVVGRKYIRLYAPTQTYALYPHEGIMSNTSQVDIDQPDMDAFPLFAEAQYVECILGPGEMLYIPVNDWD